MATSTIDSIIRTAHEYGFLRIVPAINIDSLIASSILSKVLYDHGVNAPINTYPGIIYEDYDTPILLIDLPKPADRKNLFEIKFTGDTSITARLVSYLDKIYGLTWYDKLLAVISGIYRRLDVGKEGFKGLEQELVKELAKTNHLSSELGFKLWGWKQYSILKTIYRTLIPYIPGYTGDPNYTNNMLKKLLNIENPDKIKWETLFTEQNIEKLGEFLEEFSETIKIDNELKKKILYNMLGYTYSVNILGYSLDLHEIYGALLSYTSIGKQNPYTISLTSFDQSVLIQVIGVYRKIADELALEVSTVINEYMSKRNPIISDLSLIKRPELLIEVLSFLNTLPNDSPIVIRSNGELLTSLLEYIRVRKELENAYINCSEEQLCILGEDLVLRRA
ncbi:MAG: hypothetical protein ABWW65_06980 [Thermoprotei archaeon]